MPAAVVQGDDDCSVCTSVVVLPEAQHRVVDTVDGERSLVLEQLRAAREGIVQTGTMTAEAYDADMATLEAEDAHEEFRMNARIIVLAHKAATAPNGYVPTRKAS